MLALCRVLGYSSKHLGSLSSERLQQLFSTLAGAQARHDKSFKKYKVWDPYPRDSDSVILRWIVGRITDK